MNTKKIVEVLEEDLKNFESVNFHELSCAGEHATSIRDAKARSIQLVKQTIAEMRAADEYTTGVGADDGL